MTNDRITFLEAFYSFSGLLNPPRVFVAHDVGEFDVDLLSPNSLDNVQISPAYSGTANTDKNICIRLKCGFLYVLELHKFAGVQRGIVLMKYGGFHGGGES